MSLLRDWILEVINRAKSGEDGPVGFSINPSAPFETVMEVLADSGPKVLRFTCPYCDRVLASEDAQTWLAGGPLCLCDAVGGFNTMQEVYDLDAKRVP